MVSSRSFSSAEISPGGYRVIWQADTSASVSRLRLMVACMRLGDDRGEDQQGEADDRERVAAVVAVAVARSSRPPFHHIMRMAMSVSSASGPTSVTASVRHEDVVVADVRQLVGEHAFELDPVQLLEQAGGDGDGRVLGVAAGGERVRRRVVDDVDPRLGQAAGDAQTLDEVVQALVLLRVGGLGPADRAGRWRRPSSTRRTPAHRR